MIKVENPNKVRQAKNYFAFPSRWMPMIASFVGWKEVKQKGGRDLNSTWLNAFNKQKTLRFHDTYAQNMWALEKVEAAFSAKSFVGTDSCFLFPNGENSDLPYPIEFKGAERRACVFNVVVEALIAVSKNGSN